MERFYSGLLFEARWPNSQGMVGQVLLTVDVKGSSLLPFCSVRGMVGSRESDFGNAPWLK